jgi:hypothetical protein
MFWIGKPLWIDGLPSPLRLGTFLEREAGAYAPRRLVIDLGHVPGGQLSQTHGLVCVSPAQLPSITTSWIRRRLISATWNPGTGNMLRGKRTS